MFKDLDEYWNWIETLPEDLQKVQAEFWDYTGRPIQDHTDVRIICRLLNISNTFNEFRDKYQTLRQSPREDKELAMYWDIYMTGLKRAADVVVKEMKKAA